MRWINAWLEPDLGRIILLQATILPILAAHQQLSRGCPEAGGILLGYRRGPHLEVTELSEPGADDTRGRTFFDRRDPCHQRKAIKEWRASGHYMDYIGDWHTHPEPSPKPSNLDIEQWCSFESQTTPEPMIELIIGTEGMWVGLIDKGKVWTLVPTV